MRRLILTVSAFLLLAFTTVEQIKVIQTKIDIQPKPITTVDNIPEIILAPILELPKKDHNAFLNAIGKKESGNKYNIVNKYGYMGRYQFGKSTLKGLGYKISKEEFLNDPIVQEQAMQDLLEANHKYLALYIEKFDGVTVNGIVITESGLLAAAHLGGAGSVKKWFKKGKIKKDAFGTSITDYMVQFGGYELNLNNGLN